MSINEMVDIPLCAARPAEDRSARKWIRERIGQLDPVKDYAEIVKLSWVFRVNPFMLEWAYAITMVRFTIHADSVPAITRGGAGKTITQKARRQDDTKAHTLVWMEYGPESPQARRSAEIVNALHVRWAKDYPNAFVDPELYLYVLAWQVCGPAGLFASLGLPRLGEKERIAWHIFGCKMAELFTFSDGRPLSQVVRLPNSYEEWEAYVRQYEARPSPYTPDAEAIARAVLEHFERLFPRLLQPFGRALVTSFWHPNMFPANGITPPHPALRWAARRFMKTIAQLRRFMSDAKESYPEQLRRESAEKGIPLNGILRATQCPFGTEQERLKRNDIPASDTATLSQCPMGMGDSRDSQQTIRQH